MEPDLVQGLEHRLGKRRANHPVPREDGDGRLPVVVSWADDHERVGFKAVEHGDETVRMAQSDQEGNETAGTIRRPAGEVDDGQVNSKSNALHSDGDRPEAPKDFRSPADLVCASKLPKGSPARATSGAPEATVEV